MGELAMPCGARISPPRDSATIAPAGRYRDTWPARPGRERRSASDRKRQTNCNGVSGMTVTRDDLKAVLGDLDDDRVLAILALNPTPAELEQAAVWAAGDGDILSKRGRPQDKIIAEIVDILTADEDEPEITG